MSCIPLLEEQMNNYKEERLKEKFARIEPIVGDSLFARHVAIIGRRGTARLVEYLASCGVLSFDLIETTYDERIEERSSDEDCAFTILEQFRARLELDIEVATHTIESSHQFFSNSKTSLFIGTGGRDEFDLICGAVEHSGKRGIFYRTLDSSIGFMIFLLPGEPKRAPEWIFKDSSSKKSVTDNLFTEMHLANTVANYARGLLLEGTRNARSDIEVVLASGNRIWMVGHPSWPWAIEPISPDTEEPTWLSKIPKSLLAGIEGRACMIIGLGSLGSVIADTLFRLGANLVLIDGKEVAKANPIRQIYGLDQVGEAKAQACVERLSYLQGGIRTGDAKNGCWTWSGGKRWLAGSRAEITELNGLDQLSGLIDRYRPEVAVVATGTEHDRAISSLLRESGIPHVVVSCYARARFFEAIVVDGKSSPCFGCVRGHLYLGAQPRLTPEQRARYISSDHDLAAEPATRIETGRAADLAAHIAFGLLQSKSAPWLERAFSEEQTFFLGGNSVERAESGKPAYGIEIPGEVRLFGLQDIAGRGRYLECWDCGRHLSVNIPYS
jgi:hypothetical protein